MNDDFSSIHPLQADIQANTSEEIRSRTQSILEDLGDGTGFPFEVIRVVLFAAILERLDRLEALHEGSQGWDPVVSTGGSPATFGDLHPDVQQALMAEDEREENWVEFYELDPDVQDFLINEAVDEVAGAHYNVGGDEYTDEYIEEVPRWSKATGEPLNFSAREQEAGAVAALEQATAQTAEVAEEFLNELDDRGTSRLGRLGRLGQR